MLSTNRGDPAILAALSLQHCASLAGLDHRQVKQPSPLAPRQFLGRHQPRLLRPAIVEVGAIAQQALRPDRLALHTVEPCLVNLQDAENGQLATPDNGDDPLIQTAAPDRVRACRICVRTRLPILTLWPT